MLGSPFSAGRVPLQNSPLRDRFPCVMGSPAEWAALRNRFPCGMGSLAGPVPLRDEFPYGVGFPTESVPLRDGLLRPTQSRGIPSGLAE